MGARAHRPVVARGVDLPANGPAIVANGVAVSAKGLAVAADGVAVSAKGLAVAADGLDLSAKRLAIAAHRVAVPADGLLVPANRVAVVEGAPSRRADQGSGGNVSTAIFGHHFAGSACCLAATSDEKDAGA